MISEQKVPYNVNLSLPFSRRAVERSARGNFKKKDSNGKNFDWTNLIVVFSRQPVDFPYLMQKYAMKINESISSFGEI